MLSRFKRFYYKVVFHAIFALSILFLFSVLSFAAKKYEMHSASSMEIDTIAVDEAISIIREHYIMEVKSKSLIDGALTGMVNSLDQYSEYLPAEAYSEIQSSMEGQFVGIGVELFRLKNRVAISSVIEGSPAKRSGLKKGDAIIAVDGKDTSGLTPIKVSAMIRNSDAELIALRVLRPITTTRDLKVVDFKVRRARVEIPSVTLELTNNVLIIKIFSFTSETYKNLLLEVERFGYKKNIDTTDGVVLDLRNNPGGLLLPAVDVAGLFLPQSSKVVSIIGKNNQPLSDFINDDFSDPSLSTKRVAVLINKDTASAAEILASALRDNGRCIIMGEKSFGKGLVQDFFPMFSGNGAIKLTIAKYQTPKGQFIEKIGITPDVALTKTIKEGKQDDITDDPWLAKAINIVKKNDSYNNIAKNVKLRASAPVATHKDFTNILATNASNGKLCKA